MGGGFGGGKNRFDSEDSEMPTMPTMPQMPKGSSSMEETREVVPTSFTFTNREESSETTENNGGQMPAGSNQGGSIGSANTGFSLSGDVVMLIVSLCVLTVGLVFAALFKRRK